VEITIDFNAIIPSLEWLSPALKLHASAAKAKWQETPRLMPALDPDTATYLAILSAQNGADLAAPGHRKRGIGIGWTAVAVLQINAGKLVRDFLLRCYGFV
jgi:hypothetical protein